MLIDEARAHRARLKAQRLAGVLMVTMAVLLAVTSAAHAVSIQSDSSTINLRTGHREHSGHVVVTDGSFQLRADKLIEYRQQSLLVRVEAIGQPARFKQDPIVEGSLSHGEAREIEYLVKSATIKLKNYHVTDAAGNTQKGKRATYLLKK